MVERFGRVRVQCTMTHHYLTQHYDSSLIWEGTCMQCWSAVQEYGAGVQYTAWIHSCCIRTVASWRPRGYSKHRGVLLCVRRTFV